MKRKIPYPEDKKSVHLKHFDGLYADLHEVSHFQYSSNYSLSNQLSPTELKKNNIYFCKYFCITINTCILVVVRRYSFMYF